MRSSAQMISYEVFAGLACLVAILHYQTLSLMDLKEINDLTLCFFSVTGCRLRGEAKNLIFYGGVLKTLNSKVTV